MVSHKMYGISKGSGDLWNYLKVKITPTTKKASHAGLGWFGLAGFHKLPGLLDSKLDLGQVGKVQLLARWPGLLHRPVGVGVA